MAELHTVASMRAEARDLIATAEARGFVRPAAINADHVANPCNDCLFADADEARDYLRTNRRSAATPDQIAAARAMIARAESVGYVREPSIGDAYELYLLEDADDAEAFLDDLATNDPDRCTACGALELCDCRVYLA